MSIDQGLDRGLGRTALAVLWEAVSGPTNGRVPISPAVSQLMTTMKGRRMAGKQRGRGAAQTLLGLAVLAFIAYQAARAWWQRNRDQLFAGIGHRIWDDLPSVLAFLALATAAVALLRWQVTRGPARGVATAVTLAELTPQPGAGADGSVLEQLTAELVIRDGGTARRRPAVRSEFGVDERAVRGADIDGTTSAGRPLIVRCRQVPADAAVGPDTVHRLARAAETAGQTPTQPPSQPSGQLAAAPVGPVGAVAGAAPLMLLVTTGGFSDQARAAARSAGVHLVDRRRLGGWMTVGYLAELGDPRQSWTQSWTERGRAGVQWARQTHTRLTGGTQWPPR